MRAMGAHRELLVSLVVMSLAGAAGAAPTDAKPRERRLHLASAEASSYLVNDWNKFQENYLPLYVGDDDPRTAWTLKTEGIGEWLRVHVTPLAGATKVRLKVRNGYQKTDKLWAANSRAHGLTVVLLPGNKTVDVDLTDRSGWQEIAVDQPAGPLEAIELRVRSVYPGKKYDDLCLSDVQVFVTATTPDNPAFEKQRLQKIVDWKKGRLEAVALFQSDLGKTMPIAPQYVASGVGLRDDGEAGSGTGATCFDFLCNVGRNIDDAFREARGKASAELTMAHELAAKHFRGMTPVRLSTRDKRPLPQIDGTCVPSIDSCVDDPCYQRLPLPPQVGYLDARTLLTTEQSGLPTAEDVLARKVPECRREKPTTFAYVTRNPAAADGTPGMVRAAILVTCGLVEGREGLYPSARPQLLVWGADGLLDVLGDTSQTALLSWQRNDGGPKVASAVVYAEREKPLTFTAATSVATK
jgi:hypothetical protein